MKYEEYAGRGKDKYTHLMELMEEAEEACARANVRAKAAMADRKVVPNRKTVISGLLRGMVQLEAARTAA